jgi:hypothetical protein
MVSRMKTKEPACRCISSSLVEIITSWAPRHRQQAGGREFLQFALDGADPDIGDADNLVDVIRGIYQCNF